MEQNKFVFLHSLRQWWINSSILWRKSWVFQYGNLQNILCLFQLCLIPYSGIFCCSCNSVQTGKCATLYQMSRLDKPMIYSFVNTVIFPFLPNLDFSNESANCSFYPVIIDWGSLLKALTLFFFLMELFCSSLR